MGTYLKGIVVQVCSLFKQCQILPAGYCVQECRLIMLCQNIPTGHCITGVRAV